MIALSLRQPWCYAVLSLGKHIENRRWSTAFRGSFLLHASKGMTKTEYYECLEFCRNVLGASVLSRFPPLKSLPRGGIVGAAKLIDVIPPCPTCQLGSPCGQNHGWHMPEQYGFVLENVRPSPRFVECKGMLGFFKVGDEIAQALRDAQPSAPCQ